MGYHELPTGVRVHVTTSGPPDAPPVLALHGWPQHSGSWRAVSSELRDTHRLICPDMRGFGRSGWPADGDFSKQRIADDALALLDVLGLERVCLVGHDWGGWAAILAALTAPERFSSLLALGIGHPWIPSAVAARNAHRLAYQFPLYFPAACPGRSSRRRAATTPAGRPARSTSTSPPSAAATARPAGSTAASCASSRRAGRGSSCRRG